MDDLENRKWARLLDALSLISLFDMCISFLLYRSLISRSLVLVEFVLIVLLQKSNEEYQAALQEREMRQAHQRIEKVAYILSSLAQLLLSRFEPLW